MYDLLINELRLGRLEATAGIGVRFGSVELCCDCIVQGCILRLKRKCFGRYAGFWEILPVEVSEMKFGWEFWAASH